MAVDDLIQPYQAHLRQLSFSRRTIHDYARTIAALDRDLPHGADTATEPELRAWLWRDGLLPNSRATYHKAMQSFYRWAAEEAFIDFNPASEIPRPKVPQGVPRAATDHQVGRVMTEAADPYRIWATLAAYSGLRCIEIHRLHREHITQTEIKVMRGKGEKARLVACHPLIWGTVKDLPDGPIAEVPDERAISLRFINHCRGPLGMRMVSLHRLRGWFATTGYRATKDIRAVQQSLGHVSPATTAGYIDVAGEQMQAVVMALPVFGPGAGPAGVLES